MRQSTGMYSNIQAASKPLLALLLGVFTCAAALAELGLADPTRPPWLGGQAVEQSEPMPTGPVLQSTMVAPGIKRAVISGTTYKVGDEMSAGTIKDIRAYEVLIEKDGRETLLRLVPALAKENVRPATGQAKGVNQ